MNARQRGFTLIEVLIVVVIVATLARIAIPNYQRIKRKAEAAAVIGDFQAVRVAAFEYNADTHAWPEDQNRGVRPPELEPYLEGQVDFDPGRYMLDWENWMLPDGTPSNPGTGAMIGVSLVTQDEALGQEVLNLLGESASAFTLADHYTYIFVGT